MALAKRQTIPNKLYFRIGEVSDIVGVKPYVLRYWETEFSDVRPTKSKSGQRLYKRRDVELLLQVKQLLYEERYTIDGAKQRLRETAKHGDATPGAVGGRARRVATPPTAPTVSAPAAPQSSIDVAPPAGMASQLSARSSVASKKLLTRLKSDLEGVLAELRSLS
jgi:DNA-binding transcriptional MerR regulator